MSIAKIETELKFKLKKIPNCFLNEDIQIINISQSYFLLSESSKNQLQTFFSEIIDWQHIKEARVRINYLSFSGGSARYCFLTLKSDGTLQRTEWEVEIKLEQYWFLMTLPMIGNITKDRYEYMIPNLKIELDVYHQKLKGLVIAEVEYDPNIHTDQNQLINEIKKYIGEDAINVTHDKCYKNVNLAINNV